MSKKVDLTMAVGDYESIRALKAGTVKADGIELAVAHEGRAVAPASRLWPSANPPRA